MAKISKANSAGDKQRPHALRLGRVVAGTAAMFGLLAVAHEFSPSTTHPTRNADVQVQPRLGNVDSVEWSKANKLAFKVAQALVRQYNDELAAAAVTGEATELVDMRLLNGEIRGAILQGGPTQLMAVDKDQEGVRNPVYLASPEQYLGGHEPQNANQFADAYFGKEAVTADGQPELVVVQLPPNGHITLYDPKDLLRHADIYPTTIAAGQSPGISPYNGTIPVLGALNTVDGKLLVEPGGTTVYAGMPENIPLSQ